MVPPESSQSSLRPDLPADGIHQDELLRLPPPPAWTGRTRLLIRLRSRNQAAVDPGIQNIHVISPVTVDHPVGQLVGGGRVKRRSCDPAISRGLVGGHPGSFDGPLFDSALFGRLEFDDDHECVPVLMLRPAFRRKLVIVAMSRLSCAFSILNSSLSISTMERMGRSSNP